MNQDWLDIWLNAARQPEVIAALNELTEQVSLAVAQASDAGKVRCQGSGRCCRFNSYDHLLYVTGLEAARFWVLARDLPTDPELDQQQDSIHLPVASFRQLPDGCPYQLDGLCSAHAVRPLGCRVFFCTKGSEAWQQDLYERMQQQVRDIHSDYDIPYYYAEWRSWLIQLRQLDK